MKTITIDGVEFIKTDEGKILANTQVEVNVSDYQEELADLLSQKTAKENAWAIDSQTYADNITKAQEAQTVATEAYNAELQGLNDDIASLQAKIDGLSNL